MSLQVRQEIAAAADTVAAVSCTPRWRQSTKPGAATVRRDRTEYPNRFGGIVTWQVVVTLPQDQVGAEKWMDDNLADLVAALGDVLAVRSAFPAEIAVDAGTVPVLIVEGQREE
jgi:hypothetical protein